MSKFDKYKHVLTLGFDLEANARVYSNHWPGEPERAEDFFNRVLRKSIEVNGPVTIFTGDAFIQYKYDPRDTNFEQGVKVLDPGTSAYTLKRFNEVAGKFNLRQGLENVRKAQQKSAGLFGGLLKTLGLT